MFGAAELTVRLMNARREQQERAAFELFLATLPADVAQQLREDRAALEEKRRLEEIEERRHQELCAAVRSTSFWRF